MPLLRALISRAGLWMTTQRRAPMSEPGTPIPDSPEFEKYQIYSRSEIIGLLREIMDSHVLLTIYFGGGSQFIVTNLLRVNPEFEELVYDCGANSATNRALTKSGRFIIVTFLNHVKIQMSGQRIEETVFDGAPALRMRMPDSLLRFQRREYFRTTIVGKPIICHIPAESADDTSIDARILNIGCGGIAILTHSGIDRLRACALLRNCRIDFPEIGSVTTSIEICNVSEITSPSGLVQARYGCRFVALPGNTVTLIQRYVNMLERSRLARI